MTAFHILQQILSHTPLFVWALLAFCLLMGLLQRRDQQLTRTRLIVPSVVWSVFGLWGMVSAFGLQALPLAAWALALLATVAALRGRAWPAGARFDSARSLYHVPGSWRPMAMIMAIFGAKYAVGVSMGLMPTLAQQPAFAVAVSALYGALSALFVARTVNVLAQGAARVGRLQAA